MKFKHWLQLALGVVIVLGFAIIVYTFKTPSVSLPDNPNAADFIYDFLDQWASVGGPAITLIAIGAALYMGFRSLRQTRDIQQSERKQRIIKEIEDKGLKRKIQGNQDYASQSVRNCS